MVWMMVWMMVSFPRLPPQERRVGVAAHLIWGDGSAHTYHRRQKRTALAGGEHCISLPNAHSPLHTQTGHLPSSFQTVPSLPDAIMTHAAAGLSGGRNSGHSMNQRERPERRTHDNRRRKRRCPPFDGETPDEPSPVPQTSSLPDTSAVEQERRKCAIEIFTNGNPLAFCPDCFHRDHVGDRTVAECLIMSVASQSVENTSGLHFSISGNSGKGKTHACNAMARLLPEEYWLTGTASDKALYYYDDLRPGTVLLFDDVTLPDDMQELLKSATANFREPIVHRTLTRERQMKVCTIPERCVWWLAKVESITAMIR